MDTTLSPPPAAASRRRSSQPLMVLPWAGAGLSWAAGQAALPDMGATPEERLAGVAAETSLQALAAACLFTAGALLVLASMSALAARSSRSRLAPADRAGARGSRLVTAGLYLTALGGLWLAAGRAAFTIEVLGIVESGIGSDAAVAVLEAPDSPAFLALVLTLPCLLLGPALVAAGLARSREGSWLGLALWVAGIGTFLATEFHLKAGEVAGMTLAAAALCVIGARLGAQRTSGTNR